MEIARAKKCERAPAPDDSRKPDSLSEIAKPSWRYVLRKTLREFTADQCPDLAAALTYYAVLSIFPALIALVSLLVVFGQGSNSTNSILSLVDEVAPGDTVDTLRGPLEQFSASPAAGVALVIGILLALWSASGYVGAFSRSMNRIYEIDEGRPFWKLRPMQLGVTVVCILLIVVALVVLIVSGPVTDALGSALGLGPVVQFVWSVIKWPILAVAAVSIIAILYYATPNAQQPKFRWISLGALLAFLTLVISSFLFGLYVTNFSNYDRTYGSLAGIVVFLLWLWIANLALLFGAELDAELERGRELQAGIAAEEELQLPPRDTRKSDKAADKVREDITIGRRLRLKSKTSDDPEATKQQ
ncbi:YihY/virulence factor BrkB family protein [Cryobacterium sp. TMT2-18-3]|uniref:YihY/virulence factor BrkB family protein n=1 Tax=unclassified Cryobacterium TaxID=2649013 RepID=UPI00106BB47C|nr:MULTISPECIES: YihY/virulence factor BrkB family protein [unclassified Cryobacterium]TFC26437.1 YihY/virulence factor BrkB family protein [Cryobacterium sp. TMT2-18-2]TFC64385.1 YihY/virulence factor BrkB family protein [Cryobacterium sp. TMT2-18-3]